MKAAFSDPPQVRLIAHVEIPGLFRVWDRAVTSDSNNKAG